MRRDLAHSIGRLHEVLAGSTKPLILIHGNPDPDALASAWALREIVRTRNPTPSICYTGTVSRPENESMIRQLRLPAEHCKKDALRAADRIALVDGQPSFFADCPLPRCDVIIDHHPPRLDRQAPFTDIRPRCLATSSMLTEYLREAGLPVSKNLATALYYGVDTDSRRRNMSPSVTDRRAIEFLFPRVNWMLLRRIEFSSYSLALLGYFAVALVRLRFSRGVLYSNVGAMPSADGCAQIADFLMRVKEACWALVCGAVGRKLVVVFRCDGHRKHAGQVAERAFGRFGSAGGHRTMGRAEMDESSLPNGILLTQTESIDAFVLGSLAGVEHGFRSLVQASATGFIRRPMASP